MIIDIIIITVGTILLTWLVSFSVGLIIEREHIMNLIKLNRMLKKGVTPVPVENGSNFPTLHFDKIVVSVGDLLFSLDKSSRVVEFLVYVDYVDLYLIKSRSMFSFCDRNDLLLIPVGVLVKILDKKPLKVYDSVYNVVRM